MKLAETISIYSGGPGSGCNPEVAKPRCGRPDEGGGESTGKQPSSTAPSTTPSSKAAPSPTPAAPSRPRRPSRFGARIGPGGRGLRPGTSLHTLYTKLSDGQWHSREELATLIKANLAFRIYRLRTYGPMGGWKVETDRSGRVRLTTEDKNVDLKRKAKGFLSKPTKDTNTALAAKHIEIDTLALPEFYDQFHMSPSDFRDYILHGLDPAIINSTQMTVQKGYSAGTWQVKINNNAFSQDRTIHLRSGEVSHDYWAMQTAYQGKDIAKQVFSNQLDLYDHLGLNKITIHANLDVGGYAWARYGFVPRNYTWNVMRQSYNLRRTADNISINYHDDSLKRILDSPDPKSIWLLAAYKSPAGRAVGKEFLMGEDWAGEIDLNNEEQYRVLRTYLESKTRRRLHAQAAEPIFIVNGRKTDAPFHDAMDSEEGSYASDRLAIQYAADNGWNIQEALRYFATPEYREFVTGLTQSDSNPSPED